MPETAEPNPTAVAPRPRWHRWALGAALVAFAVGAVLLLRYQAGRPPKLNGDGWEYWYMAASFHHHGTPELRPEDRAEVDAAARGVGIGPPPEKTYAYEAARDGRLYGVHFWLYAATTVPARAYLLWAGGSELGGLTLGNAVLFVLAVGVGLFCSKAPVGERLTLVGLSAVGPAIWYIDWTGAELFSWAFVLVAVITYRDRRYVWSGLAAGIAATQNPPIILFGGVAVLAAAWERRWLVAAGTALAAAVGLIPYAFFLWHFGKPNLIAVDSVRVEYISWVRTWSQLADFNQGLLPYVPLLVFGALFGTVRLLYVRDVRGLLLVAGLAAVLVGTQVSQNWHSGCDGLQRYLVWVLPLFAGVAVTGIGGRWRLWAFAVVAALAHVATLEQHQQPERYPGGYLDHTRTAKWVLTHCPRLYWAEQEIFIERTRHGDDWPGTPSDFPLAFVRPDGTVSKMLLAPADVEKTAARFDVDPGYMEQLRSQAARETGLFYAHPPHGAVRAKLPLGYWATDGTVFAVLVDAASVGKVTEQFEVSDPMFLEMLRDRAGREPEPIYVRANPGTVRLKRPGP